MENKNIKEKNKIRYINDNDIEFNLFRLDTDKYDYEVLPDQKKLILRRITGGDFWSPKSTPIHIFDNTDNIKGIEQKYINECTYFKVYEGDSDFDYTITIYKDSGKIGPRGKFEQVAKFDGVMSHEEINDEALYILKKDGEKIIYNIWMHKQSCKFDKGTKIWYSEDIIDYLDPRYHSTVLVRQNVAKGIASDTITYGFDFYRMDLATRVDSKEQQRYIKKYNVRETTKHLKNLERFIGNDIYKKCGESTMEGEVDKYLDLLDELGVSLPFSSPLQSVYKYDEEGKYILNKEYLKNLKRRYYIGKNN